MKVFAMIGAFVYYVGAALLGTLINAVINALGAWIILEQFNYSLPGGFWSYVAIGWGLAIITTDASSKE